MSWQRPRLVGALTLALPAVDQRGAGKSTPSAELIDNTTWDLVADIERLRESLSIDKWVVFGGSWGSTLALAYAQTHPAQVKGLILRGIFTLRRSELEFFYQNGTSHLFPEAWDEYIAPIPEDERNDMMAGASARGSRSAPDRASTDPHCRARPTLAAYYKRLTSEDKDVRVVAARAWSRWEMSTSRLRVSQDDLDRAESDDWALQFARIECGASCLPSVLDRPMLTERSAPLPPRSLLRQRRVDARRPAARDAVDRQDPAHPDQGRAGPVRRRLPGDDRLGPQKGVPRGAARSCVPLPSPLAHELTPEPLRPSSSSSRSPSSSSSPTLVCFVALPVSSSAVRAAD